MRVGGGLDAVAPESPTETRVEKFEASSRSVGSARSAAEKFGASARSVGSAHSHASPSSVNSPSPILRTPSMRYMPHSNPPSKRDGQLSREPSFMSKKAVRVAPTVSGQTGDPANPYKSGRGHDFNGGGIGIGNGQLAQVSPLAQLLRVGPPKLTRCVTLGASGTGPQL